MRLVGGQLWMIVLGIDDPSRPAGIDPALGRSDVQRTGLGGLIDRDATRASEVGGRAVLQFDEITAAARIDEQQKVAVGVIEIGVGRSREYQGWNRHCW